MTETRDPRLAVAGHILQRVSPEAAALVSGIPVPDRADRLLETLLALPEPALRVAAAERLDHARHLHVRDETEWAGYHAVTREAYVPVTARVDPVLAGRLDWWCDMFHRRFLQD